MFTIGMSYTQTEVLEMVFLTIHSAGAIETQYIRENDIPDDVYMSVVEAIENRIIDRPHQLNKGEWQVANIAFGRTYAVMYIMLRREKEVLE